MLFNLFKPLPSIPTQELNNILTRKTVLIDVRTPFEYQRGHITYSRNIPLSKIQSFKPKQADEPIYLVCQSGARSKRAGQMLQKMGHNVVNVRGGINQWSGQLNGGKH